MGAPVDFYGQAIPTQLVYLGLETSEEGGSVSSSSAAQLSSALTIKRMMVERVAAQGENNTITYTLVQNDTNTGMKVSLSSNDTFNYMDTDIPINNLDQLYTKSAYVGTITHNTSTFYNVSYLIDGGGVQNFFGRANIESGSLGNSETPLKGAWQYSNIGNERFPLLFSSNGTIKDFFLTSNVPLFNVNSSGICEYKLDLQLTGISTSKLLLINDTIGTSYSSAINKTISKNSSYTVNESINYSLGELASNALVNYSLTFEAATLGNYIYGITDENLPSIGTFYGPASGVISAFDSTHEHFITMPIGGTIINLMAMVPRIVGNAGTVSVTLRKNFIDTILSATFTTGTAVSDRVIESINDVVVEAGDKLSIKLVSSGTMSSGVNNVNISWTFASSIANYYPVFWSDNGVDVLPTVQEISPPINFYSRPDTLPVNFYSLP